MLLKLVPENTDIKFLSIKKYTTIFSTLLIIGSLAIFFVKGLNTGIDFEGGIMMEVGQKSEKIDVAGYRSILGDLGLGEISLQPFGDEGTEVLIRMKQQKVPEGSELSDSQVQQEAVTKVKVALEGKYKDMEISYRRTEVVGPKVSGELVIDGLMAVGFAVLAVLIYIWLRFEWQFGLGAVIALVHDVLLTIGFFSITGLEFNLSIVAAILTIVGYSLNDTVVVYDRIREKLRMYQGMELEKLLNIALNKTLSRTVMTSLTTLLALFALFYWGGAVIHGFTAAMIWGVFVGTYSSMFIAVPVLQYFNLSRETFDDSIDKAPDFNN
jgi:preprotein translocase subunit SecF